MAPPKRPPTTRRSTPSRSRSPAVFVVAALVAVVVVIAIVVALVVGGGDDDDAADDETAFRRVAVDGDALPAFTRDVQLSGDDPAIGAEVPVVSGTDYAGHEVTIDPATDGATLVVLLAHWCPHCNAEIPVLNEWRESGEVPEDLHVVAVSTGVDPGAANYPPGQWLEDMDWQWPVLADDRQPDEESPAPAMGAYGGTSYPTMVLAGSDGRVLARFSGEYPAAEIDAIVEDALASEREQ